jgi:hypothetical protein
MRSGFNTGEKKLKSILALAAFLPLVAHAAGTDDLWEVTTQMNMAGMPAGMGAQTQQVCTEKSAQKKAVMPRNEKCKVTDYKESGNKVTISMSCPEGTGVLEQTYNAARTEYKGTMKMKTRDGDMTMDMNGRKVGSCDVKQQTAQREQQQAEIKQQVQQGQAQAAAIFAKASAEQAAQCEAAVETMDAGKLGFYGHCQGQEESCRQMRSSEMYKGASSKCMASRAEYCKRYQTMDGFLKAKGDEPAAKMCNVSVAQVKSVQCPRAAKDENLNFLVEFCDAEAKPVAQARCVGREYTSRIQDKYTSFCLAYYTKHMDERPKQVAAPAKPAPSATEQAVQQGVQQGINKLKGLFGR